MTTMIKESPHLKYFSSKLLCKRVSDGKNNLASLILMVGFASSYFFVVPVLFWGFYLFLLDKNLSPVLFCINYRKHLSDFVYTSLHSQFFN